MAGSPSATCPSPSGTEAGHQRERVAEDTRYVGSIVPIRDGVMMALRSSNASDSDAKQLHTRETRDRRRENGSKARSLHLPTRLARVGKSSPAVAMMEEWIPMSCSCVPEPVLSPISLT